MTPFRCSKVEDLKLSRNQKVNIPIRCSQQIRTIEIIPKLPKGLDLIDERIVGILKERCENNHYKIHVTSAVTPDSYDDEFAIDARSSVTKSTKEGEEAPVFISLTDYWYVYQSLDIPPVNDWSLNNFNPMLVPYVWVYSPPNNLPSSIGEPTTYYRSSFELTYDLNNLEQFLIKVTSSCAFVVYINGFKVYARGIDIENGGEFGLSAKEDISVTDYELYAPKELFINGNNTVGIVLHSTQSKVNDDKELIVEVSGITGNNDEPITQTILNDLSSTGMSIELEKRGDTQYPSLGNLINGDKEKLSLLGTEYDQSSLFPNTITCKFANKAKYINEVFFITVTNNDVFPKSYMIQGTMHAAASGGAVWEDLLTRTEEKVDDLGWEKSINYALNNPNHHLYEAYRIVIESNFNYNVLYGNYLEIGEFTVRYKKMGTCVADGYSDSVNGGYGVQPCPEGEFGGNIKYCTSSGFADKVHEQCKPAAITGISYPNENTLTFYIALKNYFVPFYEGLAKSFSISCGESPISSNIKINKYGVIYGITDAAEDFIECEVTYVGDEGDTGSVNVKINSEGIIILLYIIY